MSKFKVFINGIVALVLVLTALGASSMTAQAGMDTDNSKMDPYLLGLIQEKPDGVFRVIVQKTTKEKDAEWAVAENGGRLQKPLEMIDSFSAEMSGKEVLELATRQDVHWISSDARVFVAGGFNSNTFKDGFNSISYSGSTGTNTWTLTWKEVGESDGVNSGRVRVAANSNCAAGNCLRLGGSNVSLAGRGVYRPAPLVSVTSATLTFTTRVQATSSTTGTVSVQVSKDNGSTWTTLDTFSMKASDSKQVARSYDISAYATAFTRVRFLGAGTVNGYLHIDDIQIEYSRLANSYVRSVLANNAWVNNSAPGEENRCGCGGRGHGKPC